MQIQELIQQDFGTLSDLIRAHAQLQPAHPAIVLDDEMLDYCSMDAQMDQVAASLQREGLVKGDVIAICAKTSLNYACMFLGALRAGVTVAPLAPDSTADGLARMVADSGASIFCIDQGMSSSALALVLETPLLCVALDDSTLGIPFSNWLAHADMKPLSVMVDADSAFNIIYSSGTTGMPKGIVMPHAFRWAQIKLFQSLGYGPEAVTMVSIPLYSNMTLSSFLPSLGMGCKVVLMSKFDPKHYLQLSEKHRVTHSMMVPVQYQRIMDFEDFNRYDLSSFRMKSCGSAPFSAALKADILRRWPGELIEYYGMTEGGVVCILNTRLFPDKLHTVGQPASGHDLRVIDDAGQELPRGSVGEVVGHSGTMMTGYHNLPEKTAEAEWFDSQGLRFIRSGDVGRVDEEGFLTLLDRKKDMIISGGFNVYPSDLETLILQHPDVSEVAVVGVTSERWGETPVAFVVRRPQATVSKEDLQIWANQRLNKAQRISMIEWVDHMPRNDIGKVLKRSLRASWLAAGKVN